MKKKSINKNYIILISIAIILVIGIFYFKSSKDIPDASVEKFKQNYANIIKENYIIDNTTYKLTDLAEARPESVINLGAGNFTISSGFRGTYKDEKLPQNFSSFKLHAEKFSPENYPIALDKLVKSMHKIYSEESNTTTKKSTYDEKEVYLTDIFVDSKEYNGVIAVASILLPDKNMIITVYFFNTAFKGIEPMHPGKIIKKIIDNEYSYG